MAEFTCSGSMTMVYLFMAFMGIKEIWLWLKIIKTPFLLQFHVWTGYQVTNITNISSYQQTYLRTFLPYSGAREGIANTAMALPFVGHQKFLDTNFFKKKKKMKIKMKKR